MKEPILRNVNPDVKENFLAYLNEIPFMAGERGPLYAAFAPEPPARRYVAGQQRKRRNT